MISDSRASLLGIETAAASVDFRSPGPPVLGFLREAVCVEPRITATAKVTDRPNSPQTVVGDWFPCTRHCKLAHVHPDVTINNLFRPNGRTCGRRSARRNTSPTGLVDRGDEADFGRPHMRCLGLRQNPRDRARDRDLHTVANARSTRPEQHPGMQRRPPQPVCVRGTVDPIGASRRPPRRPCRASSVMRRCSMLDLTSVDAM